MPKARSKSHRALVAGDTLQDRGSGLQFLGDLANTPRGAGRHRGAARPLLDLPVEVVLATHGGRTTAPRSIR